MSDAVVYFLPWMRRGLVRQLASQADADGVPTASLATVTASVVLGSETATRELEIAGPGVVIGVRRSQIVRRFPTPNTRDFERNDFPHVELASPDLPWMFTPASARADRLMPWLVLVVVEERDGVSHAAGDPLPVLTVDSARRELPDLRQASAWAHVQAAVDPGRNVGEAFATTPEAFIARLLCPRRLDNDRWYRACLVPSFEAGRRAGLGEDVGTAGNALAWLPDDSNVRLPVYESWRFRTAAEPGDFESLVRRLRARTLDGGVGVHALDVGEPGSAALPHAPGTTTGFVGALVSTRLDAIVWPPKHKLAFGRGLRQLLNRQLAASSEPSSGYDPLRDDPVVGPPAYGALAAGIDSIPAPRMVASKSAPEWLGEVNLDAGHRAVAGLGAEVVRQNQESLLAAAWEQAAAAREANALLNRTRLALEVGQRFAGQVEKLEGGRLLQLSRGAHHRLRIAGQANTVRGRLQTSALPDGLVSGAFRRRLRAGTTIDRARINSRDSSVSEATLCGSLTRAFVQAPLEMLAFAELTIPVGAVNGAKADQVTVSNKSVTQATAVLRTDLGLADRATTLTKTLVRSSSPLPSTRSKLSGGALVAESREGLLRRSAGLPIASDRAGEDAVAITELGEVVRSALDPAALLRVRVRHLISPPELLGDQDVPAGLRIDPQFPEPLYELLVRIDPELLMPGVGTIATDTIALARINPAFVEAFLLGANHELGREFIWREFPADPRATWLRSFWDSVVADASSDSGAVEDIPRVREWRPGALGTHCTSDPEQTLVLILKSDLLERYPNTLIYAAAACWLEDPDTHEIERVEDSAVEHVHPSFVGSLGADVTFLGFVFPRSVKVDEHVVGSTTPNGSKPGWFFVFEELPTEPRFGMDEGKPQAASRVPKRWENLNWYHALGESTPSPSYVDLATLTAKLGSSLERPYDDDGANTWSETWARTSAAMARITLQRPVRMLVHADQMLRPGESNDAD